MKKSQLKLLIKKIIKEAAINEIFGLGKPKLSMEEPQKWVVDLLTKRSFSFEGLTQLSDGKVVAKLSRPYGKGRHGGPKQAIVFPDGTINDKLNVDKFLSIVGEQINKTPQITPNQKKVVDFLVKRGWDAGQQDEQGNVLLSKPAGRFGDSKAIVSADGRVNGKLVQDFMSVGESMAKVQKKEFARGVTTPMGAVNVGENEEEKVEEQTGTGAVAGYSTPFAFSKKGGGSSRAIKAAKKYGKVVKSISEIEKK